MGLGRVTIPSNSSFEQTARILNDLVRKMPQATEAIKDAAKLRDGLTDVTKRVKQAKEAADKGSQLARNAQQEINKLRNLGQQVKDAKKVTDALKAGKWSNIGGKFAQFMKLGFVALTIFNAILGTANAYATIQISESTIRQFERNGREFATQFRLIQKAYSQINTLRADFKKLKGDLDATKKTVYADVQNLLNNLPKVRKTANDALYEVRQGRKILEAQIANAAKKGNDALYEVRQGRAKLEAQQATIKKQANDALYETRQGRVKIDANLAQQAGKINTLTTRVQTVETRLKLIPNTPTGNNQNTNQNNSDVIRRMDFPNLIRQNAQTINTVVEPYTARFVDGKLESFRKGFDGKLTQKLDRDKLVTEIQLKTGQIVRVMEPAIREITRPIVDTQIKPLNQVVDAHGNAIGNILKLFEGINGRVDKQERRIDKEGIDNDKQAIDLEILKQKVREQERVNAEGNKKLDDLLKWSLGIPPLLAAIPAKAAQQTSANILPQIPTLTAQGVCRTTQPGGCTRKALDDLGSNINQNTNASNNNLFDKINAGLSGANTAANAAILQVVNRIDTKVGPLIPGGLSTKLINGFKWLQLDRALAVLTFAATVQNHLMLSREIGTTLLGAFSNILSLIGLKDDDGQGFDLGSIINSSIENLVKGIIGAENYTVLSENWAKANRIYQATTNVLNSFQSLSNTILAGMELIGSYTGKIGNALKKGGQVLETAYGWMNPQPKFNRVTQTLQNLQQGASTIQQVTQAPLDVINAVTELQNANTELVKAIKEDAKPENKGIETPEPEKLKADELASKIASRISNILPDDLFNAAD